MFIRGPGAVQTSKIRQILGNFSTFLRVLSCDGVNRVTYTGNHLISYRGLDWEGTSREP